MLIYWVQSVLSCGTHLTSITPHRLSLPYIWHRYTEVSIWCPSLQTWVYLASPFPISTVTIATNTKFTLTTRADGTNVDNHVIWRKGRKWDTGKKTKGVADAQGRGSLGDRASKGQCGGSGVSAPLSHPPTPTTMWDKGCSLEHAGYWSQRAVHILSR